MVRMLLRFVVLTAAAVAATWLAYRPGNLTLEWLGLHIELPLALAVLAGVVGLLLLALVWSLVRRLLHTPGAVTDYFRFRRTRRGHEALSAGMIAVSAGDIATARRQALVAARILPDEPLAKLLEAETAGLEGDARRVKVIYADMLGNPQTEMVALRGLFDAARRSGDAEAARRYAEQALKRNAGVAWASSAMLAIQSAEADWPAVSATIEARRKARLLDDDTARRDRAVVLTAQAMDAEDSEPDAALDLATRAHKLDPALVPAAVIAGRLNIQDGSLRRAARLLEKTWALSPHPDIAAVYAHARTGDSPLDRMKRVRDLLKVARGGEEGAVALAQAAIDARDWKLARQALEDYADERPRARICTLMAEIEEGEFGDKGRTRQWLARAVRAPRDPVWFAHGMTSRKWLPVSPVNGELGAFRWTTPPEALAGPDEEAPGFDVPAIDSPPPEDRDAPAEAEAKVEVKAETEPTVTTPLPVVSDSDASPPLPSDKDAKEVTAPVDQPATQSEPPEPPAPEESQARPAAPVSAPVVPDEIEAIETTDSETVVLPRQPDDPGPDTEPGGSRKAGWLGRRGKH